MNKRLILRKIIDSLEAELENYAQSARAAHEDATHEQSKAENKYDTRGLEASYLARGQSRQALETLLARDAFDAMPVRAFGPEDPVDVGALVTVEGAEGVAYYLIGPRAGGTEVSHQGKSIIVVTPQSPLGSQLIGTTQGSRFTLERGGRHHEYRVEEVE